MSAPAADAGAATPTLRARRLYLDTRQEAVVVMHRDCPVCRSEGFDAHARVELHCGARSVIATLYQVHDGLVAPGEAGLSDAAWRRLEAYPGAALTVSHAPLVDSLHTVRARLYGERFDAAGLHAVVRDVVAGRYSDIELAAFVAACAAGPLSREEIIHLTGAMVDAGERLHWPRTPVLDKHCVGGLPGNRTTPIVVAIGAACGLVMPKTSSRAITSPAGTADVMEVLTTVDLDVPALRAVVEREGACLVWGGAVRLSPADDTLIRVERALDVDSEGQLVASVLSKKIAAGATHVVLDVPVGPTAKVRSHAAADALTDHLLAVAQAFGLHARVVRSDGSVPVGRGIGPALEVRDVLDVLTGAPGAPADLRARALELAGAVLELGGAAAPGQGPALARAVLDDGRAWRKFQAICAAQGGLREPPQAPFHQVVAATANGRIGAVDNRRLARVAKLAGAPEDRAAGVEMHVRRGDAVSVGQPLYTIHAESRGELAYAAAFAARNAVYAVAPVDPAGPA